MGNSAPCGIADDHGKSRHTGTQSVVHHERSQRNNHGRAPRRQCSSGQAVQHACDSLPLSPAWRRVIPSATCCPQDCPQPRPVKTTHSAGSEARLPPCRAQARAAHIVHWSGHYSAISTGEWRSTTAIQDRPTSEVRTLTSGRRADFKLQDPPPVLSACCRQGSTAVSHGQPEPRFAARRGH